MTEEIWKDIPKTGKSNMNYQVSNLGRVKRLPGSFISWNRFKHCVTNVKEKILKHGVDQKGYHVVVLYGKMIKVHRLVAIAFLSNEENHPIINHINSITSDNRVENLEWCTYSHNAIHSYQIGNKKGFLGRTNNMNKFTETQIIEVKKHLDNDTDVRVISDITGVTLNTVRHIRDGKSWSWLTGIPHKKRKSRHNGIHKRGKKPVDTTTETK